MGNLIEVKDLNKSFGKRKVLNDVSFTLREGEILGFIGPNGAGKTTTIKLMLGLQNIDSGSVLINGFDIKKDFVKAIEYVGAIIESPDLYMYLSGRKNLQLIAAMYKNVDEERINEVVKIVGLEDRINDKVSKYSLGMRQRLGIAAALLNNPKILILDEPTNGLDPEGIKELKDLFKVLVNKNKIGILISSHNLAELESFCTDVCLIQNGSIVASTTMEEIKNADRTCYTFKLNKTTGLGDVLSSDDIILDKNNIKVYIEEKEVPEFIKILVDKGIKIFEVKKSLLSLEDAFMSRIGGYNND